MGAQRAFKALWALWRYKKISVTYTHNDDTSTTIHIKTIWRTTMKTTYANILFTQAFQVAERVEFDKSYHNGTGYFNRATEIEVEPGAVKAMMSDDNRRILLLGTIIGTIVVFDRYSDQAESKNPIFVYNSRTSKTLKYIIGGSALKDDYMCVLLRPKGSSIVNAINSTLMSIKDDVNNVKKDEDDLV